MVLPDRAVDPQRPASTYRRKGLGAIARIPPAATAYAHRHSRIMVNVAAYVNFVGDEGEPGVRAAYPGATWDRLAAVKLKYDPANVFRLNHNIPPA